MIEEIGEPIDVIAAFSTGKIFPLLFSWRNRRYNNLKVHATWSQAAGNAKLVHFSVTTDNTNLYELCFHTRYFHWQLVRVYHG